MKHTFTFGVVIIRKIRMSPFKLLLTLLFSTLISQFGKDVKANINC